jgi:hypothetical protein
LLGHAVDGADRHIDLLQIGGLRRRGLGDFVYLMGDRTDLRDDLRQQGARFAN